MSNGGSYRSPSVEHFSYAIYPQVAIKKYEIVTLTTLHDCPALSRRVQHTASNPLYSGLDDDHPPPPPGLCCNGWGVIPWSSRSRWSFDQRRSGTLLLLQWYPFIRGSRRWPQSPSPAPMVPFCPPAHARLQVHGRPHGAASPSKRSGSECRLRAGDDEYKDRIKKRRKFRLGKDLRKNIKFNRINMFIKIN